jgi:two-component system sensor histidine kinase GlrK
MAHELRNPLSSIKMAVGLLLGGREGQVTSGQKELLVLLDGEINRLIKMINTLLDLAKIEAGMMTYRFELNDLTPLIDQVIKEMKPLVDAKEINLESKIIDTLPLLRLDHERMLQVLRNLIGNAAKFTPRGGHVKVAVRPVEQGVEVSVADTGPGIPAEYLNSIFEKYKQAPQSGSNQSKGTGLGLAMAKQIVTHHGGKIWVQSELGQGSTFIFVLPA